MNRSFFFSSPCFLRLVYFLGIYKEKYLSELIVYNLEKKMVFHTTRDISIAYYFQLIQTTSGS